MSALREGRLNVRSLFKGYRFHGLHRATGAARRVCLLRHDPSAADR